ncbi:histidine triad nucleotide-binding protein [Roseinatronobacter monicus]|uniref:Histidine triad (HIT) family protein n=1 Tax=Roseinatronobacter monicus TaxID=393481 RepID=A0A543KA12_9RHOB|nr:histidine triad nucleotide-binding protein [Roseinatronobacter monicus]TQM91897.1 histidine triad (HIT) family protein [Roseinatronobacter monicus]
MTYAYDDQNIFAKILRGEIPCSKVYESDHTLAFNDISPKTPHHVLVIPKGPYVCYDHFAQSASDAEIVDYTRAIGAICTQLGVAQGDGGKGYRMISNAGPDGVQEVPHLHVHILAGRNIGPMVMMRP